MAGINKVILIGRLGKKPEIKYSDKGDAISLVSLATSEKWTDKQGQKQEKTEWHRVVFFGKLAEVTEKWLDTGSQIYIQGKLQTRKWQDKSGADRWTTEIVVSGFNGELQMLDSNKSTESNVSESQPFDDDIPF